MKVRIDVRVEGMDEGSSVESHVYIDTSCSMLLGVNTIP